MARTGVSKRPFISRLMNQHHQAILAILLADLQEEAMPRSIFFR